MAFYTNPQSEVVKEAFGRFNEVVLYDLETTGLDPTKDRVIEFSGIKLRIDGQTLVKEEEICVYINPQRPLPEIITEITGYTDEFLADKPVESDAFGDISAFLNGVPVIVGYNNISFDNKFLSAMYERNGKTLSYELTFDVLLLARQLIKRNEVENYKLGTIAHYLGVDNDISFHKASDDILATYRILNVLLKDVFNEKTPGPVVKKRPQILSIEYWEGFKGFSRIYVNTNLGTIYFDVRDKSWNGKDVDIDSLDMQYVSYKSLKITGSATEDEFARYKGKTRVVRSE